MVTGVVDSQGEHASQVFQTTFTFFLIQMENHFCITFGCKTVALFKIPANLAIIVYLTVKGYPQRTILIGHGLSAAVQINNGKTPMT